MEQPARRTCGAGARLLGEHSPFLGERTGFGAWLVWEAARGSHHIP